jgi:hypothetical protein
VGDTFLKKVIPFGSNLIGSGLPDRSSEIERKSRKTGLATQRKTRKNRLSMHPDYHGDILRKWASSAIRQRLPNSASNTGIFDIFVREKSSTFGAGRLAFQANQVVPQFDGWSPATRSFLAAILRRLRSFRKTQQSGSIHPCRDASGAERSLDS